MATLFDEILLDPGIFKAREGGVPASGSPSFANTRIFNPATGVSKVNVSRLDTLERLTVDLALLTETELEYFLDTFCGGYANAVGLRVRVPYAYKRAAQVFGAGNASRTQWTLVRTRTRRGVTARQDVHYITKPVMDTPAQLANLGSAGGSVRLYEGNGVTPRVITTPFQIFINGSATTAYTVNNTTGLVTFNSPPATGAILTWTGEYDTPMRISGNELPLTRYDVASEVQGVQLEEIPYVELGITVV